MPRSRVSSTVNTEEAYWDYVRRLASGERD